jgi:predicted patatin/cPLA2 family phospholipase
MDGDMYWDASLRVSIPFQAALNDGYTHVLVLKTRPGSGRGSERSSPHLLERTLVVPKLGQYNPDLPRVFMERPAHYAAELAEIRRLAADDSAGRPPFLYVVEPAPEQPLPSGFERNRDRLVEGARLGMQAVYAALGGERPAQLVEVLGAYYAPAGVNTSNTDAA